MNPIDHLNVHSIHIGVNHKDEIDLLYLFNDLFHHMIDGITHSASDCNHSRSMVHDGSLTELEVEIKEFKLTLDEHKELLLGEVDILIQFEIIFKFKEIENVPEKVRTTQNFVLVATLLQPQKKV